MATGRGRPGYTVKGARETAAGFDRFADRVDDLERPNREAAEIVATRARTLVPIRTGALLDTIRVEADDRGGAAVAGDFRVDYAAAVHFGSRKRNIDPQPFLFDAAEDRAPEAVERYEQHIGRLVDRFEAETPG